MLSLNASQIMEELVGQLGSEAGHLERVISEYHGTMLTEPGVPLAPEREALYFSALAAIDELRRSWGPTASPHWVDDILPGRKSASTNDGEYDTLFALFAKHGIWGYVRVRCPDTETPEDSYVRLILGVVRDGRPDAS